MYTPLYKSGWYLRLFKLLAVRTPKSNRKYCQKSSHQVYKGFPNPIMNILWISMGLIWFEIFKQPWGDSFPENHKICRQWAIIMTDCWFFTINGERHFTKIFWRGFSLSNITSCQYQRIFLYQKLWDHTTSRSSLFYKQEKSFGTFLTPPNQFCLHINI